VAHVRPLDFLVTPFVAAGQGVPAVAVAPIILLLFQGVLLPKLLICAAVVLFPMLVTTITALRRVDRDLIDVALVFGASRLQRLIHVELPLAVPVLLAGVKLGLTLSITGAVVAEFVASDAGLGFMVNTAINSFDAVTRYVALVTLAVLSMTLYGVVSLLERMAYRWLDG
jgi:NitT/TauT family transport system permease protein